MKKITSVLLCIIMVTALISACGSEYAFNGERNELAAGNTASSAASTPPRAPESTPMPMPMPEEAIMYDSVDYESTGSDMAFRVASQTAGNGVTPISAPVTGGMAEKIIYSVYADIETLSFDETISNVYILLAAHGAFIENSSISGTNYASRQQGRSDYRFASFYLRVPRENLDSITEQLNILGNIVHRNSSADNITSQFVDTQSRLNSLTIQEERLLTMLSQAEDIPDLIIIEERLSDVRYQIEWLTTTLNNWQNQVDYSNLTLSIREVEQLTEQTQIHRTYWQQIGDGLLSTIQAIGRFFMDVFMWLIIAAPVLIILVVIVLVTLFIVRRAIRANKKKMNEYYTSTSVYSGNSVNIPPNHTEPPDNTV